ncbi:MAG: IS4 family transposase [Bacteroidetes bacterium]|nr:IS4 family transposase [Bacteroidota bacterium]
MSLANEDTQLLTVFQAHFAGFLNLARVRLMYLFVGSLCKVRSVNFSKLSAGFDNNVAASSNYRRIQRFIAEVELPMKWISQLIFSLLPQKDSLVLVLDRTNWKLGEKNINILMLGVSYKNVAFPLMFRMLDKRGNSHTSERIALVQDFIDWFGKDCIDSLVADREFVGKNWLAFLNENNIRYHIRIRNNFKVFCPKRQKEIKAWHLFNSLKAGQMKDYHKIMKIQGQYCYLSGMKTLKSNKLDFCIIVSFNKPEESLEKYRQRWQIETLFRGLKSSGFNLGNTHVTHLDRLEKLILLVMVAFVWCYKIGDFIDSEIKPIKIKKHGNRAISIFKYGLDYLSRVLISKCNYLNINYLKFLSCT